MPFAKIWVHLIWSTKNRQPLITKKLKPQLLMHIRENAWKKKIFLDQINCVKDHCHALISLGTEQTISKVAMLIKGESSHWINSNQLIDGFFQWQDEYIAVSVSDAKMNKIRNYIKIQEEHHLKKTFKEEYNLFLNKYGLEKWG